MLRAFKNLNNNLFTRSARKMNVEPFPLNFMEPLNWPPLHLNGNFNEFTRSQLEICKGIIKPSTKIEDVHIEEFMEISDRFPAEFATDNCRVKAQPPQRREIIREQIASAYPIVHECTLMLYFSFLEHKQRFGNEKERRIYRDLGLSQFVQRLLTKRCVFFYGTSDHYKLLNGSTGDGGFEQIGTAEEQAPLLLEHVLSYDEIKLSALLYATTHSEFINNGARNNAGLVEADKRSFEREGVIIGMIGARFERPEVMEYEDILVTPSQNTVKNGYGANGEAAANNRERDYRRMWREFYDEPKDFLWSDEEELKSKRFEKQMDMNKFDKLLMSKRYAVSFDTLLLEAEARAKAAGKPAYIHMVGYGLGVWQVTEVQQELFFEQLEARMRALGSKLTHIGVMHLSWFHIPYWGGIRHGRRVNNIEIRISRRNPADKLDQDMLPIVTYAWDANALPGNEFWNHALGGTSDPAAAASTLISELQNPHINYKYMSGDNLHIASAEYGVLHIADYAQKIIG
ncbi:CG2909 [Drosophila busckii]|uniref:CG2909 n=1 Tax=Drosophila busckii TaxID=30019 RepID=A0A0M4EYU9_DROBS|nr:uncharacterized protein LOC108605150 [Drosophila busckii]ALC49217.1 CG2909 [Drosophila busckii]